MHVDYSLELGKDDPALEIPWSSQDEIPGDAGSKTVSSGTAAVRYYDLKSDPRLIVLIPETAGRPELATFLLRMNAEGFPLQTAKCDLWQTRELVPEEEIFNAECKHASYVDLIFASEESRLSLEKHEALVKTLCVLLQRAPDMPASAEFVVRRCYYHSAPNLEDSQEGFCVTAYVSGYNHDESEARLRWAIALKLVQYALVQWAGQ